MQANIHPNYNEVKVIMPDGSEHKIMSTYGKKELHLDVDWRKHPAWTGGNVQVSQANEKIMQFNKRYGGLNLMGKKEENQE